MSRLDGGATDTTMQTWDARGFQSPPRETQANKIGPQLDETNWWKVEMAYDDRQRQAAALRLAHQKRQEELRLVEQNAWLGKRAKQKRFVFSADQKRMLRQWFDALDADRSGKISVEELEDPMLSIGIVSDTKEIQEIVNTLDKDANGLIDFQEFVEILTPHHAKSAATQEKHERMFMQLTKKMEHQSTGFLEINTQLSMERRRFILDAITRPSHQAIANGSADPSDEIAFTSAHPSVKVHHGLIGKQKKLDALDNRRQVDLRFQALEKAFIRNGMLKNSALPALTEATTTPTRIKRGSRASRGLTLGNPL